MRDLDFKVSSDQPRTLLNRPAAEFAIIFSNAATAPSGTIVAVNAKLLSQRRTLQLDDTEPIFVAVQTPEWGGGGFEVPETHVECVVDGESAKLINTYDQYQGSTNLLSGNLFGLGPADSRALAVDVVFSRSGHYTLILEITFANIAGVRRTIQTKPLSIDVLLLDVSEFMKREIRFVDSEGGSVGAEP